MDAAPARTTPARTTPARTGPDRTGPETPAPAPETRRAYRSDWRAFETWCHAQGHRALPATPASVLGFLTAVPGLSGGTLARRAAAIAARHRAAGLAPPTGDATVTALLHATRHQMTRRQGPRPRPAQLGQIAAACPRDLAGMRDRALLLLAAAPLLVPAPDPDRLVGAALSCRPRLTRLQLVTLTIEQLRLTPHGIALVLPDAASAGATPDAAAPCVRIGVVPHSAVPGRCPVQALQAWLAASDTRFGPVFRKVDRWDNVEHRALGADAVRRILARRRLRRVHRRSQVAP
jgi:hypothetical protein